MLKSIFVFLIPFFTLNCGITNEAQEEWKNLYRLLAKCEKVEPDQSINYEIVYFEAIISDSKLKVYEFKGNPSLYMKSRIHSVLDCVDISSLKRKKYRIIYVYSSLNDFTITQQNKNLIIENFKKKYDISYKTEFYWTTYGPTIR